MSPAEFRRAIRELWMLAETKQAAKKSKVDEMSTDKFRNALRSMWSLAEGAPQRADTSVFVRFGRSVEFILWTSQHFSLAEQYQRADSYTQNTARCSVESAAKIAEEATR